MAITTVSETAAVNTLAHYLLNTPAVTGPVTPDDARIALAQLAKSSHTKIMAGVTDRHVLDGWEAGGPAPIELEVGLFEQKDPDRPVPPTFTAEEREQAGLPKADNPNTLHNEGDASREPVGVDPERAEAEAAQAAAEGPQ